MYTVMVVTMLVLSIFSAAVAGVPELKSDITNHWEFLVAVFGIIGAVLTVYFNKISRDSKQLVESEKQREQTQTENRRLARDRQVSDMKHDLHNADMMLSKRIDDLSKIAEGVGMSLDRHVDYHKERDIKLEAHLQNITDKVIALEKNSISRHEFSDVCQRVNDVADTTIEVRTTLVHIKEQLDRTVSRVDLTV